MMNKSNKFLIIYILLTWCLVGCNKTKGREVGLNTEKLHHLSYISYFVWATPDPFINHLKHFIMPKQDEKSNIVYDSFSDKHWNMETFFEKLADYHNGNMNELCEQLITAIETLNHMPDDAILSEMAKASTLNLLIVRECLQGIEISN